VGLRALFGAAKPTKTPCGDGTVRAAKKVANPCRGVFVKRTFGHNILVFMYHSTLMSTQKW